MRLFITLFALLMFLPLLVTTGGAILFWRFWKSKRQQYLAKKGR